MQLLMADILQKSVVYLKPVLSQFFVSLSKEDMLELKMVRIWKCKIYVPFSGICYTHNNKWNFKWYALH